MQHALNRAHSFPLCAAKGRRTTSVVAKCSLAGWPEGCWTARSNRAGPTASFKAQPAAFAPAHLTRGASRRSSVKVQANWGAPVDFVPAKVVSNTADAAGPMHRLVLDVGALAAGYAVPGQYMQVKVGDSKPGFFAIASAPGVGGGKLEFLIKSAPGGTAELLCHAAAGAEVSVSPVMGKGFALERIPASTTSAVLLFATGSGISPIRAVLESGALKGRDVTLYYGTRNEDSTAFKDLLPAWREAGVKVVQVFSETKTGYVHDLFEREGLSVLPADAASSVGALLCGQKGMCQAVTALLTAKGVPAEKILLNF